MCSTDLRIQEEWKQFQDGGIGHRLECANGVAVCINGYGSGANRTRSLKIESLNYF